jgi:hypothetical protein
MEKKIIEQAAWLWQREAGIFKSILNSRVSVGTLLDGAHLGWPGEAILRTSYSEDYRRVDLGLFWIRNSSRIAASNPGIKIVASRFLQSEISGDVLAVLEWKKFYSITHDEAENEGFIKAKEYYEIFTYIGDLNGRRLFERMQELEDEFWWTRFVGSDVWDEDGNLNHWFPEFPNYAYQVTKTWHGRIFLVNREKISQ